MASNAIKDESVISKTNISIEKLPDGTCIKRITEIKDGKKCVKEEKVDCDSALKEVRGDNQEEDKFKKENLSFDERIHEKLKEMKQSFADGDKKNAETKSEMYSDGANKIEKVTRESSSIEETKKTEKIPNGTKRILKITRESFVEETKKSLDPGDTFTEDLKEKVKILDDSFAAELKEKCAEEDLVDEKADKNNRESENFEFKQENTDGENESKLEDKLFGRNQSDTEELTNKHKDIAEQEDGWFKKIVTTFLKIIFFPLYKLNIL